MTPQSRVDVAFRTDDGLTLRGWHYVPDGSGPFPTVVMAHGYSAVKEMYLDRFAEVFAAAGIASVVYDNRNLGASDGEPRQEVDPWMQVRDFRDAITFAETLPATDRSRIGLWGSSYSGGHVIVVAAMDWRVKCVVAQVPGLGSGQRLTGPPAWLEYLAQDRRNRFAGGPPATMPVVSEDGPSALPTADSHAWFTETASSRAPAWMNEVTVRSLDLGMSYHPAMYVPHVAPTPLLMIVALRDSLIPAEGLKAAFKRAGEPKKLIELDCGHFEPYVERFDECAAAARDWFATYLAAPTDHAAADT